MGLKSLDLCFCPNLPVVSEVWLGATLRKSDVTIGTNCIPYVVPIPIGSMYGIYANIWGILMVNVTIYGIHGSYGILYPSYPILNITMITLHLKNWWAGAPDAEVAEHICLVVSFPRMFKSVSCPYI